VARPYEEALHAVCGWQVVGHEDAEQQHVPSGLHHVGLVHVEPQGPRARPVPVPPRPCQPPGPCARSRSSRRRHSGSGLLDVREGGGTQVGIQLERFKDQTGATATAAVRA
jgi:hypothetical protein